MYICANFRTYATRGPPHRSTHASYNFLTHQPSTRSTNPNSYPQQLAYKLSTYILHLHPNTTHLTPTPKPCTDSILNFLPAANQATPAYRATTFREVERKLGL